MGKNLTVYRKIVRVVHFDEFIKLDSQFTQSAGGGEAIKYPNCISSMGKTLPMNECPGYDTKQSNGEIPVMLELWGMWSTPSLPSLRGPFRTGMVTPDWVLSIGQIELNCVLMLSWIVWIRTVFWAMKLCTNAKLNYLKWNCFLTLKLCTYAKLNYLRQDCFCMVNWSVWNRTVFDVETVYLC